MDVFALSCMNPEMVNELIWQGGSHIGIGGSKTADWWLYAIRIFILVSLMQDGRIKGILLLNAVLTPG